VDDLISQHVTTLQLEAALDGIRQAPKDNGRVELIMCRPGVDERQVLETCDLDLELGLRGDNWKTKGYRKTADGNAHPDMQITLMNSRVISAIAGDKQNWSPAGDQFFVDFNLSDENLPPGTRLKLGNAELEVTEIPHLGCKKFTARFGREAMLFVNSELGKSLNLRGVNARVVSAGTATTGDAISKL
jgi:MOSC domain-containing protein YiiM